MLNTKKTWNINAEYKQNQLLHFLSSLTLLKIFTKNGLGVNDQEGGKSKRF